MTGTSRQTVALVTGGSRGIGLAVATSLCSAGALVVVLDRDLEVVEVDLTGPGRIEFLEGDVASSADVRAAVMRCQEDFGGLDVAVANAGIVAVEPFLSTSDEMWRRTIDVNLTGAFITIREAARAMAGNGGGSIVVTASTNAFWVESNLAAYNTSKGGVVALVKSAALDLAQHGIRVNSVSPGLIRTRLTTYITDDEENSADYLTQIPLGRFGTPGDVAAAVQFLVSEDAAWITGVNIPIDGGQTLGTSVPEPESSWLG